MHACTKWGYAIGSVHLSSRNLQTVNLSGASQTKLEGNKLSKGPIYLHVGSLLSERVHFGSFNSWPWAKILYLANFP